MMECIQKTHQRNLHWALIFSLTFSVATTDLLGQSPPITDVAFAPNGKEVVASSQAGLQVYNWPELKLQKTIPISFPNIHVLQFSPDGQQLAVGGGNPAEDGVVEILSWPNFQSLTKLTGHDDSVIALTWTSDQQLVSASLDRVMLSWDIQSKKATTTYRGHSRGISAVCKLRDETLVSAARDLSVRVWNRKSAELLRSLNQHSGPIHSIAVCPAESTIPIVATAAADRTVRFWQPTIGRMMRYIRLESEPLDVAWISDVFLLASCVNGQVCLINTQNVTLIEQVPGIDGWAYTLAIHPNDGSFAVAGSNGVIRRGELALPSQ